MFGTQLTFFDHASIFVITGQNMDFLASKRSWFHLGVLSVEPVIHLGAALLVGQCNGLPG